MNDLGEAILKARADANNQATNELATAKERFKSRARQAISVGEQEMTFAVPKLSAAWVSLFVSWVEAGGLKIERKFDDRDGDYFNISGLMG